MLQLPHLLQDGGTASLLVALVLLLAFLGILFFLWSFVDLLFLEYLSFRDVRRTMDNAENAEQKDGEKGAARERLTLDAVKKLLSEKGLNGSIIGDRLRDICSVLDGAKEHVSPPQLQDMHRMSVQTMMSRVAPTGLRIISTVLLICGICGTLWGVHGALAGTEVDNMQSLLNRLPSALEPSKWAVFCTVLLLIGRGIYEAVLERFICRVDELTITRILPDLQPASNFTRVLNDFSAHIDHFSESTKKYTDTAEAMKNFVDGFEQSTKRFSELGDNLGRTLSILQQLETRLDARQKDIDAKLETAASSLKGLSEHMGALQKSRETMLKATEDMQQQLQQMEKDTATITETRNALTGLTGKVDAVSGTLSAMESIRDKSEEFRTLLTNSAERVTTEVNKTDKAISKLQTHVSTIQNDINNLNIETETLSDSLRRSAASSQSLVIDAAEFKTKVRTLSANIESSTGKIDSAVNAINVAAQSAVKHLETIQKGIKKLYEDVRDENGRAGKLIRMAIGSNRNTSRSRR